MIARTAKNKGELPPGYKGVRELAYDKWRAAQKSASERKKDKIQSLGETESHDTEGEDEMSGLSELEDQDMVCWLQHVQADDDDQKDGWQPVS